MKSFNKAGLHILFWIAIPLTVLYFKWAAQETTTLPGLPVPGTETFFQIIKNNLDVIFVSLLGSIPVFYCTEFCLAPRFLFEVNIIKIFLFTTVLISYYFIVRFISELIFPMYYFFGDPYAIKVLVPVILLSTLCGTMFAYKDKANNHIQNIR